MGSGVLFTIRGLRWPVIGNSSDPHIRVIEFWGEDHTPDEGQEWYYDKTTDLKNITLKILVVEHPPEVVKYIGKDEKVFYHYYKKYMDLKNFRFGNSSEGKF